VSGSGLNIDLLHAAVRDGLSDVVAVALEVGASAAHLGVPLHEVLDHVERAYAPDVPDFAATRAAAVAWAEGTSVHQADLSCDDPLTSLATVPHLRSRLGEICRGADRSGVRVTDSHALVVVELPRSPFGHELESALRALDVGEALRSVFPADETIVQLTARRFAVLTPRSRADALTLHLVGVVLDEMRAEHGQARLWVELLPASAEGIGRVLAGLCE
jgi:hypothetical protein